MNQRTLARRGLSALAGTPRKHLLALAVGACFAAPSHAGPVANGRYNIVAVHSGKCVDVSGVSATPGALVHQWTCDPANVLSTKKNQIWRLTGKA